jgi:hypothetical protein
VLHVASLRTVQPGTTDCLDMPFSDNSDKFQMEILVVTCTTYHMTRGHGSSMCSQKVGNLLIMTSIGWRGINRSGARVWHLFWPFLAYIEHICNPPTLSLTHIAL